MRSPLSTSLWSPLVLAAGFALAQDAAGQAFSADYGLSRQAEPATGAWQVPSQMNLGRVQLGPVLQVDGEYSGAGLSVAAGHNWFAQVSVGRSLQQPVWLNAVGSTDAMRIGGGYRWSDGQSLSLHVTGARAPDRLGLSVSYDWPRYFVRLSYDTGINPAPNDRLRLSAGVRF